ncbi:MAG: NAD-glutamate dehydrogenase [Gammaproteobacteria bacterium]|nr:NAD-glutamate dehydrogenase [Gammaproteobacteria bacterium]
MTEQSGAYVSRLVNRIGLRLSAEEFERAAEFAELFWSRTPEEDLAERSVDDDAGATIDSWRQFQRRRADQVDILVENPEHARDGWQSSHTVVRVMAPDMPFVVDSVLIALSHDGLITHHLSNVVFAVDRVDDGSIQHISLDQRHDGRELFIYAEIDRVDADDIRALTERLERTAADLQAIVADFIPMKEQLAAIIDELADSPPALPGQEAAEEVKESIAFLAWLSANNFTFLGYREFEYRDDMMRQTGESLGSLRERSRASERRLSDQPERTLTFLMEPVLLSFSKSGTKSRVHRPAYPDYVGIKRFDNDGKVVGERGFLGLYTSRVYAEHPRNIPLIRRKVENVIAHSDLDPNGFDGKVLAQVLATYPRDELFQINDEALLENTLAITHIHERRRIRVFTRFERYGLFVNCLVFMPRDLYNTQSRTRVEELLMETFDADDIEFEPFVSESILVRLQIILRIRPGAQPEVDRRVLEQKIAELVGDWVSDLNGALTSAFGETRGRQHSREYGNAFPAGYRENFNARSAADDVANIEALSLERSLLTRFYRLPEDPQQVLHLKVFNLGEPLPLSDIIPQLENMGLRVTGEHPYRVRRASGPLVSIDDFHLVYEQPLNLGEAGERFEDAFTRTWHGSTEDDGYNRLVLGAGLTWRQVSVLRTYAKYMKQIRFGFSQEFISDTLNKHRTLAAALVAYFEARFNPDDSADTQRREQILASLDDVELLNEDRILRRFLELMDATKRTNYFTRQDGEPKPYVSIKVAPPEISDMPLPLPMFEVFVCAPYFEGVHLRGGAIARGGLRWSDRLEDYRTEVLGLVKAQVVKNAVIVPTGAKGGFVIKTTRSSGEGPDVVSCYRDFIRGLLDITDNIVHGEILTPQDVRRYDDNDPYLVVAADKGTATFSDEANGVAAQYHFWLGDAFASGGSNGYDHKKMGITARGAWVSVQRHFAERSIDVQREPVTVLGIGDMGGDVFGNGMLLSPVLKLVAAFNHLHIFVDPDPDPALSFAERERLFALPRSSWADYDEALISKGGGVFPRQAKFIDLTPEIRATFDISAERLAPDELINALLKAPVQLIWNGGIGTYVKSAGESHSEVGDRANDHLRADARDLRCAVFGEGGNLGLTQRARIDFNLAGGAVNTDFIDNSAGVDCSDHEVNIKIALNEIVASEDITTKQRNSLLENMTDAVARLVLANNARQVQALSLAQRHSHSRHAEYQRFITRMEADLNLDRGLENLPTDDELGERFGHGGGISRPELAILLAYAKTHIKQRLVESAIHEDRRISREALKAFPQQLIDAHAPALLEHRLCREIIATQLANDVVDHMGITFIVHLMEFVGGTVSEIVRAYFAAAESFAIRESYRGIEALEGVAEEVKLSMLLEQIRLGRRATRWILRHRRNFESVSELIDQFQPSVQILDEQRASLAGEQATERWNQRVEQLLAAGVPEALAKKSASTADIAVALPVIDAAQATETDPPRVASAFIDLGAELGLDWLTDQLGNLPSVSHWQAMERDSLLDDITTHQSTLAAHTLNGTGGDVRGWLSIHSEFAHSWQATIEDAQHAAVPDFSMFSMTCRKLNDLCRGLITA